VANITLHPGERASVAQYAAPGASPPAERMPAGVKQELTAVEGVWRGFNGKVLWGADDGYAGPVWFGQPWGTAGGSLWLGG
jgi:hypothetical protein